MLTLVYDVLKDSTNSYTKYRLIHDFDKVLSLSLFDDDELVIDSELDAYIKEQIEIRNKAKREKNFSLADQIRDELMKKNIKLIDSREGTKYEIMQLVIGKYMDLNTINVLVLAYLGDTIYEDYIRKALISRKINHVDELQKEAVKYVSAKSQAEFLHKLIEEEFFTEEEMSIIKRARNYKSKSHPKNCNIITYRYATALEAVIGYLELKENKSRINEIMLHILGGK